MKKATYVLFLFFVLTGCNKTQTITKNESSTVEKNTTKQESQEQPKISSEKTQPLAQKENQKQTEAKQNNNNDTDLGFTFDYPNEWAKTKFSKISGDSGFNFQINFDNNDIFIYGETNDFVITEFPGNNELIPGFIFRSINISKNNFFPSQSCSNLPNVDYINNCSYVDLNKNGNPDIVVINVGYQIPPEPKPLYVSRLAFINNKNYKNFVFALPLDELDDENMFNAAIEKNKNKIKEFDKFISTIKFKE